MNKDGQAVIGGSFEYGNQTWISDRVSVHGGKQTHAMKMRILGRRLRTVNGVRLQRVQHEVAKESIGIGRYCRRDALFVAMCARDETGLGHPMPIQLAGPALRKRTVVARDVPSQ